MNQNNDQQEKILARVRKMMRLANDAGATEGERDNAMRAVHATLAKYNLSLGQVEAGDPEALEKRERFSKLFLGKPWAIRIAHSIADMYFCKYFYATVGGNAGPTQKAMHTFVGRHSNVVTAQEMAQFVVESVNREAQRFQRSIGGAYGQYRAFAQGAAQRIQMRCMEIRRAAEKDGLKAEPEAPELQDKSAGTALVVATLYKTEEDANKNWLEKQGVKLTNGRSESAAGDLYARAAGHAYGSKVSLHKQVKS